MDHVILCNTLAQPPDDFACVVSALTRQLQEDVQPYWCTCPSLEVMDRRQSLGFLVQDAVRRPETVGHPVFLVGGRVQARRLRDYLVQNGVTRPAIVCLDVAAAWDEPWSVVLSRLLLWIAVRGVGSEWVLGMNPEAPHRRVRVFRDLCTPVAPSFYWCDGVAVADFLLPTWFDNGFSRRTHFMGATRLASFQVGSGGSCVFFDEETRELEQCFGHGADAVTAVNRFSAYQSVGMAAVPEPPRADPFPAVHLSRIAKVS